MNEGTFKRILNHWYEYYTPPTIKPFEEYFNVSKRLPDNLAERFQEYIKSEHEYFPTPRQLSQAVFVLLPKDESNLPPGVGQLAARAATENRCTAILVKGNSRIENGEIRNSRVCGVELNEENRSPDPYLCMGHHRVQQDYINQVRGSYENEQKNS